MTTLRRILAGKSDIHSVAPEATVIEALTTMARKNVGALLVMSGDKLVGIFSERDYARKVILVGKTSRETRVSEIMTAQVVCVGPDCTPEEAMAVMTEKRVRHLPVLEGGRVIGVVSIGDVVRAVVEMQQFTIEQLQKYILTA
jgi:CBS domain-containing protein